MDPSNFEQFKKTGTKLGNNTISINNAHSFGFNSGFYHRNNIKDYRFVVLFYNKKDRSVAFFFTNNEAEGKFTVTHSNQKTSGGTTARSFFTTYNLEGDLRSDKLVGKYEPQEFNHPAFGKMFFIELDKKIE